MSENKSLKKLGKLAGSTLMVSVIAGLGGLTSQAHAVSYSSLGTGAEVRSALNSLNSSNKAPAELKCAAESNTTAKSADKAKEAKCGEGKCGGDKVKAKDAKSAADSKSVEAKCGEGKCGGDKKAADKKAEKAGDAKTADSKSAEAKCGEGKCGS